MKAGQAATTTPALTGGVVPLDYPVQLSKVHAPPLRDDTLARDRLLDWLSVKIHSRVVLLVAEAGYGKTTLLADFSRRTRIRVLWFRLDRGDRDWIGFISHLVAAVRVFAPTFGSATASLLRDASTRMPTLDAVLDSFVRELGSVPWESTALIFDDVHAVDDSPDVRTILREILMRGPERMSFLFASRREPPVRLARLRALGEVAELDTESLRFDATETRRLFSETYAQPLEPSVLAELNRRTEGWAASLQLVRAAIHDRTPSQVRAFVSSLSGAEGHLYEYLAEEVIGDLPDDLQQFLMRTSILETVDLKLGPVAAGVSEQEARVFIDTAERQGLLARRGMGSGITRAHPLVRDFLKARLSRSEGQKRVREIHEAVARAAGPEDWHRAARHYLAAGLEGDARQVLSSALERILATGLYLAADEISAALAGGALYGVAGLILKSRVAQQRGVLDEAVDLAERARELDPASPVVLANLATARNLAGDVGGALDAARQLGASGSPDLAALGKTFEGVLETSMGGSLKATEHDLVRHAHALKERGERHYRGVALLNLAVTRIARGAFASAMVDADEAVGDLASSSAGLELVSARTAHAVARAFLGEIEGARAEIAAVISEATSSQLLEIAGDMGEVEALVGDTANAWALMSRVAYELDGTDRGEEARFARALLHFRDGNLAAARIDVSRFQHGRIAASPAFEAKRHLAEGLLVALEGGGASQAAVIGATIADQQGAGLWACFGRTLIQLANREADPSSCVIDADRELSCVLSGLAELVLMRISDFNAAATDAIAGEAERRPWRWREAIRRRLAVAVGPELARLAALLERIGELEDVERLGAADRAIRDRTGPRLGMSLARRLADKVFVEDLGRVRITVGRRPVEGGDIRRRVLALLCLLLSKPRFASTRDEVLDSLWPEHDPSSALNSLNQTVYFLRRVFEPNFRDDISPGYVGQDGETIWLDTELIDCRSHRCLELIRAMPGEPSPEGAVSLAREYRGRFALDFAYEEWSVPYRDALHAGYLRVVERAVRADLDSGHLERGVFVAERAAEVDPDAEEIQAGLVRLYRYSSAHAAAAEQYAHYAKYMTDLGVQPPAIADL